MKESLGKRDKLSERQRRTPGYIADRIDRTAQAPTLKEIGEQLGAGISSAYTQVTALERKGYIRRLPDTARGITIVRLPPTTEC